MPFTYVITDIHGRYDLLMKAVEQVRADLESRAETAQLVFLGDYVDRGPQSREVVEFLSGELMGVTCLKGNHEELMIQALQNRDPEIALTWTVNGGQATLRSYEAIASEEFGTDTTLAHHVEWMAGLPSACEDEHRIYVHAGLMPRVPLAAQEDEVLLWIRERFLRARAAEFPDGKHIVHGHTPSWARKLDPSQPELLPHRTNLDTGAFATGVLTVGVFDANLPGGPVATIPVTL